MISSPDSRESENALTDSPIRIAILECDTPLERTRSKYGGYGGVFTSLLHAGADALGLSRARLDITSWDVVNKPTYPQLDEVDAVLLTGSRMSKQLFLPLACLPRTFTRANVLTCHALRRIQCI